MFLLLRRNWGVCAVSWNTVDRLHSKGSLRRPMCFGLDAHLDRQDLPGYQLPLLAPARDALGMSETAASCCRWRDRRIDGHRGMAR